MTRAIIVPFHQYVPRGITTYYRNYFEFFLKQLKQWKDEFDQLYLVDHAWDFTVGNIRDLEDILGNDRFTILPVDPNNTHWQNIKECLPKVKEDYVLTMDLDLVVYKKNIIKNSFEKLASGKKDFVSMFDGSGGLTEQLWTKFPYLKEKEYRRFASYFCFSKKELLLDLDFAPNYYPKPTYIEELGYMTEEGNFLDSFGLATIKILSRLKPEKVGFIPNDFSSLHIDCKEVGKDQNTGAYHIRNWNLALHLINEKYRNKEAYEAYLRRTPATEACRLLAWLWIVSEIGKTLSEELQKDIYEVAGKYEVSKEEFNKYLVDFKKFHSWLNN